MFSAHRVDSRYRYSVRGEEVVPHDFLPRPLGGSMGVEHGCIRRWASELQIVLS